MLASSGVSDRPRSVLECILIWRHATALESVISATLWGKSGSPCFRQGVAGPSITDCVSCTLWAFALALHNTMTKIS